MVVQSLVLSHMNYCLIIWGTTTSSLISKVQRLQNFSARVAAGGIKKFDHVSPAYKELKWPRAVLLDVIKVKRHLPWLLY